MISHSRQRAASLNLQHRTPWYGKQKDWKNHSIRLSDQKLFLLQNLDAWIYSEDVHWWNSTKGDQNFLTDMTLGLQNPQAATTTWTQMVSGFHHGLEPSKASHRQFPCDPGRRLQATQLAEIKLPGLDVVHGRGWPPGTQADDLATASLGTCNILILVGYTQPECHKTSFL